MGNKKKLEGKRLKVSGFQEMDQKEGIDNSALVVGLYNQDSCIPVANFFTINLPSGRTEDARAWL